MESIYDQYNTSANSFYQNQLPQIYLSQNYSPYFNNQNRSVNIFIIFPQNSPLTIPNYIFPQQNPYLFNMPQQFMPPYQMQSFQTIQQPSLNYPFTYYNAPQVHENKKKIKKSHENKSDKKKIDKKKSNKKRKQKSKKKSTPPPKMSPYCTFAATGSNGIYQKFYYCNTCGITGGNVICEICANHCHRGHDLELTDGHGFCDCPDFGHCQCMPHTEDMRCVCEITGGRPAQFPLYQCSDCSINGDSYICQNCAISKHHGHNLTVCEDVSDKICYYYRAKS